MTTSTIASPSSTKPFDEVSEASPKPSSPPTDEEPTMMLAPTTKQSSSRDRTLIEPDTKPTFETSDNGSNDKDLEDGNPLSETKKVGDDEDGDGPRKMEQKKLVFIGLGLLLVICFLGGFFGTIAKRMNRSETTSAMAQEMNTRPPSPALEITLYTDSPTQSPTESPSMSPSGKPIMTPTALPTAKPTDLPTAKPTATPTMKPQPTTSPQPTESPTTPAPTRRPTAPPTMKPTLGPTISAAPTEDYASLIQRFLFGVYSVDVFSGSKASKANNLAILWLAEEAEEYNRVEFDGKFVQRFVLAAQDLAVQEGKRFRNAQKGVDVCDWNGIKCDSENWVTDIWWSYQESKKGFISPELRHLVGSLKVLDLSNNQLKEEIPEELYQLTNLEKLYLFNNELKGTISSKIADLDSITHFHLSHNKLKGTFPVEIKSDADGIRPLEYFNVYSNELTGTLPEDMRLRQVTYFDVGRNKLTGTLPVTLGEKFVSLRHLHLDHNEFTGTLPESYNTVGNGRLESFSIDHNALTGEIPGKRDLYNKLVQYTLHSNQFTRMNSDLCRIEVPRGECVELRSDCAVCTCNGFFDLCDVQCLEEPSASPTEAPTDFPTDPEDDEK